MKQQLDDESAVFHILPNPTNSQTTITAGILLGPVLTYPHVWQHATRPVQKSICATMRHDERALNRVKEQSHTGTGGTLPKGNSSSSRRSRNTSDTCLARLRMRVKLSCLSVKPTAPRESNRLKKWDSFRMWLYAGIGSRLFSNLRASCTHSPPSWL